MIKTRFERFIGNACSKGGGHIEFNFEGGGCGSGVYADIVISLSPVEYMPAAEYKMFGYGDKALKDAHREIETALKYWIDAGRPGWVEKS